MFKTCITTIALAILSMTAVTTKAQSYPTRLLDHESQINEIIKGMTLEEKIEMLHGKNMFSSSGIPRLGIADMEYADGPFGIREEMELCSPYYRFGHILSYRFGFSCHMEH